MSKQKDPPLGRVFLKKGQLPTFALACARLSSARPRFTAEFGKGSGSSAAYMPPNHYSFPGFSKQTVF